MVGNLKGKFKVWVATIIVTSLTSFIKNPAWRKMCTVFGWLAFPVCRRGGSLPALWGPFDKGGCYH